MRHHLIDGTLVYPGYSSVFLTPTIGTSLINVTEPNANTNSSNQQLPSIKSKLFSPPTSPSTKPHNHPSHLPPTSKPSVDLATQKSIIADPDDLLKTVVSKDCNTDLDGQDNFETNCASSSRSLEVQPSESSSPPPPFSAHGGHFWPLSFTPPSSLGMDSIPTVLGQNCLAFLLGKLASENARLVKLSNGVFGLEKHPLQRRLTHFRSTTSASRRSELEFL